MGEFLSSDQISLKICGVTLERDAIRLAELGVEALGVNFWPKSKRYCAPPEAKFLRELAGKITRVGVFVNAPVELPQQLLEEGLLDFAQFHGDEDAAYCEYFAKRDLPYLRAVGVKDEKSIENLELPQCKGILLDAHAPGVYGGTGKTCDWTIIPKVQALNLPIILAGGITPANVGDARKLLGVAALDVASGAESKPGIKDFAKVEALMAN